MSWEIFVSLCSILLVFLSAILTLYFTTRKESRRLKFDEVQFIIDERRRQAEELKEELELSKQREKEAESREQDCLKRLHNMASLMWRGRLPPELKITDSDNG